MDGYLETTGSTPSDIKIFLASKGSDVALGKLPIDQMILVSSLLQAVTSSEVTFESESISKDGKGYILNGVTTSGKHRDKISLPVTISRLNQGKNYILSTIYNRNGTVGGKNSQAGQLFGEVKTKSDIQIAFGA